MEGKTALERETSVEYQALGLFPRWREVKAMPERTILGINLAFSPNRGASRHKSPPVTNIWG